MRLIPYIRVSTDEQADHGHSLTAQRHTLTRFGEQGAHFLLETLADEGVSGGRDLGKRKGGAMLLAQLRSGIADGVVVTRMDRLVRDLYDALGVFREANRRGWAVVSATEMIDTATPGGELQLHLMLATAQYERRIASMRTAAVSASLRERGKVYGTTPYGCVAIDGALVRDPRTWGIREQIVEWHNGRRYSLGTIRGMLYDLRIAAPAGGRRWGRSSIAGVIETHDSLSHLPLLTAEHDAPRASLTNEAEVSHESEIGHNSPAATTANGLRHGH